MSHLFPLSGRAKILGITGPAGAGKSTLVNACIRILREENSRVAVVAIDPTSPISRGAFLGDRVRMIEHWNDTSVFIRSVATRGQTGGLAACALGFCVLLDTAGFDFIFVETVGAGQGEVDVASIAHLTALVLMPGAGDDVQAIKAGIMEVAGIFVINKADLPGADDLREEVRFVQNLLPESLRAPIYSVSALNGTDIREFMHALLPMFEQRNATLDSQQRWQQILRRLLQEQVLAELSPESLAREAYEVSKHSTDPFSAVRRLVSELSLGAAHGR